MASLMWLLILQQASNTAGRHHMWTVQRGGSSNDYAAALEVDPSGSLFLAGDTESSLDGNPNAGSSDVFIMKFDGSGSWQWTAQRGGSSNDYCAALEVDPFGSLFLAGYTWSDLDGNPNAGNYDVFIMKFEGSGSWQWTVQRGGSSNDYAAGLEVDPSGSLFLAGHTESSLDGNPSAGNQDIFIMKFDGSRSWQWTVQRGASGDGYATALEADPSGSLFLAGFTWGDLDGNPNAGSHGIFIMKFDGSGSWQWTVQRGASGTEYATALKVDLFGSLFLAGHTESSLDGNRNAGGSDVFIMKFDGSGSWQWTVQRGASGDDIATALEVDPSGSLFLAGYTKDDLDGNRNAGGSDVFIMKFDGSGSWQWTVQRGGSNNDYAVGLKVDPSGSFFLAGNTWGDLDGNRNAGGRDVLVTKFQAFTFTTTTKTFTTTISSTATFTTHSMTTTSSSTATTTARSEWLPGSLVCEVAGADREQIEVAFTAALLQTLEGARAVTVSMAIQGRSEQGFRRWGMDYTVLVVVEKVDSALDFMASLSSSNDFQRVFANLLVEHGVDTQLAASVAILENSPSSSEELLLAISIGGSVAIFLFTGFALYRWRSALRSHRRVQQVCKEADEVFKDENPKFRWAMISARFDGGEIELKFRKVHSLLKKRGCNILMVSAGAGQDFGTMTMQYLHKIKESNGVMIALCTKNYGEKTASSYSSHEELIYALDNKLEVLPLRLEDTYPPEPACGPNHQYDKNRVAMGLIGMIFKSSVVFEDCRGKSSDEIADILESKLISREYIVAEEEAKEAVEKEFDEENPLYRWAMISARFDGGEIELKFRKVHSLLKKRGCNILMVSAGAGQDFGTVTMRYLNKIKESNGVMIALCTPNYAEKTRSPYSSHEELFYALDHHLDIWALKVHKIFPPQPPCGPSHPFDKDKVAQGLVDLVFKPGIEPMDCLELTAEEIAEELQRRLQCEPETNVFTESSWAPPDSPRGMTFEQLPGVPHSVMPTTCHP